MGLIEICYNTTDRTKAMCDLIVEKLLRGYTVYRFYEPAVLQFVLFMDFGGESIKKYILSFVGKMDSGITEATWLQLIAKIILLDFAKGKEIEIIAKILTNLAPNAAKTLGEATDDQSSLEGVGNNFLKATLQIYFRAHPEYQALAEQFENLYSGEPGSSENLGTVIFCPSAL